MKANKYILKFIYSLAGVFVVIFALIPIALLFVWLFWTIHTCVQTSLWWGLTAIPALAICLAFGEKSIEWMENRFEDAGDLIDKVDI